MEQEVAPLNRSGDVQHSRWDSGQVTTPDGFREAYQKFVAAGWGGVPFPADHGGGGFPWLVGIVLQEIMTAANLVVLDVPAADPRRHRPAAAPRQRGAAGALPDEDGHRRVDRHHEPHRAPGGLGCRRAPHQGRHAGDGTYRITGQKIFITFGEHDLADNIIHLVLARTPDAPPGTKGISCFIVPKYLVDDDGSLGERNDVECVSIEHKMGINASPTCVHGLRRCASATSSAKRTRACATCSR